MQNRLVLFGSVSLTGPEEPLLRRASQQRRLGLLALIASSPHACASRDRVLGLLWPDRPERAARHILADSLYVLRKALGDEAIVASGDALQLSPELVWSDVVQFRSALAQERWSDALDLYLGDFLDAFHLPNAPEFERWALTERMQLQASAVRAASTLVTALERAGRMTDAVKVAERRLELVSSDEVALRDLVRLLVATDNLARAEAVARGFIERLALELDMAPSEETMRLVRELRVLGDAEPIVVVVPGKAQHAGTVVRRTDTRTGSIIAQGRHHWRQRTRMSVERAIEYFTRATERDPRAAGAWSGLADCWIVMAGRGYAPPPDVAARARTSAERALAVDDTLSSVHASLGGTHIVRRNWRDAESALRRALVLDQENAEARHWLAMVMLTAFGDCDTALREQTISARLDPAGPMQAGALGWLRYLRGDYELAREEMEPAADLNGELEAGHAGLARVAARLGDGAAVTRAIAAGLTKRGDLRGDLLAEQASALAVLGDVRRATRLLHEASAIGGMPLNLALAWASVGDADRAFDYLAREAFLVYWAPHAVWWDPRFDAIRDDRRFASVREGVARAWSPEWM